MREIPESVKQFISNHIHSIDVLEILLLIRKEALRNWDPRAVSSALSLDCYAVEARLVQLTSAGFLVSQATGPSRTYRYNPSTWQLASEVNQFAHWYWSHPMDVMTLVFTNRAERLGRL